MKNLRAVLLPAPVEIVVGSRVFTVKEPRLVEIPQSDPESEDYAGLDALQSLVGGLIEPIVMPLDHSGYINEEGKLYNPPLPLNDHADALWKKACRESGRQWLAGDYIGGPCVILGPVDEEGNDTAVSDEFLALMKSMALAMPVERGDEEERYQREAERTVEQGRER